MQEGEAFPAHIILFIFTNYEYSFAFQAFFCFFLWRSINFVWNLFFPVGLGAYFYQSGLLKTSIFVFIAVNYLVIYFSVNVLVTIGSSSLPDFGSALIALGLNFP